MPKTFNEWLFLFFLNSFCVLYTANIIFAALGLAGSLALGTHDGFDDSAVIFGCSLIGFLFLGELSATFLTKPERILKSALPNVIMVIIRSVWLTLSLLLLY